MVTGLVNNKPTSLLIAHGIKTREKACIQNLYDFGVTCSYDEVLRFKTSAAVSTVAEEQNPSLRPITDANEGLIQAVADNFDANVSSQNGLKSTHALALLLTQNKRTLDITPGYNRTIDRISRDAMKTPIKSYVKIQHYQGPKRPNMPANYPRRCVLALRMLAEKAILNARARDLDLQFMRDITLVNNLPEFGGYNTAIVRRQGQSMKPGSSVMYTPLIDMIPSDPDTMMTAMWTRLYYIYR